MTLTHWKKLDNPDYIGAYAFQPGEEKTVTIAGVNRQIVNGPDGKREECTIVSFEEAEKPLILNACNGKMIAKMADSGYIEHWPGVRIVLAVEKVKAFGEVVEAVRVKQRKLPRKTTVVTCSDCGKPIEGTAKVSAQALVNGAIKRFGVPVCAECGMKRKERMSHDSDSGKLPQPSGEQSVPEQQPDQQLSEV